MNNILHHKNDYEQKIHNGGNAAWDASDATLNYIAQYLKKDMNSLETGAGKSSLIFAKYGGNHICITPSQNEVANIKSLADEFKIDISKIDFKIDYSQNIVPKLPSRTLLDIVFIDGGHGFPIPQIDWFYTAPFLKIGGKLIIDDIDLWTGKILVDFLKHEKGWQLDKILRRRTAIFTKTKAFEAREWCDQDFVIKKSYWLQIFRKVSNALKIILSGDFKGLKEKLKQEKALKSSVKIIENS